jgi:hypothetical protein
MIWFVYTYIHELIAMEITKQTAVAGGTPTVEHTRPEFREPRVP